MSTHPSPPPPVPAPLPPPLISQVPGLRRARRACVPLGHGAFRVRADHRLRVSLHSSTAVALPSCCIGVHCLHAEAFLLAVLSTPIGVRSRAKTHKAENQIDTVRYDTDERKRRNRHDSVDIHIGGLSTDICRRKDEATGDD